MGSIRKIVQPMDLLSYNFAEGIEEELVLHCVFRYGRSGNTI